MAHAHKNTLLSRMGFDDSDREHPDHDLGVSFLVDHANEVSAAMLGTASDAEHVLLEHPVISRQFVVGFIDLVFVFPEKDVPASHSGSRSCVAIEVKARVASVSSVIRQLKLYELNLTPDVVAQDIKNLSYSAIRAPLRFALATPQKLNQREVNELKSQGYRYVRLGERFEEWKTNRSEDSGDDISL